MKYQDLRTALKRPRVMIFIATELTPGNFAWIPCTKTALQGVVPGLQDEDEIVGHVDQQGNIFIGLGLPKVRMTRCRNCSQLPLLFKQSGPYRYCLVHQNPLCPAEFHLETHQESEAACVTSWNDFNGRTK